MSQVERTNFSVRNSTLEATVGVAHASSHKMDYTPATKNFLDLLYANIGENVLAGPDHTVRSLPKHPERVFQATTLLDLEPSKKIEVSANPIIAVAKKVWDAIKFFFSIPLRYVGAKDWSIIGEALHVPGRLITGKKFESGYERKCTELTKEQTKGFMRYVSQGAFAHSTDEKWIVPYGYRAIAPENLEVDVAELPGKIEVHEKCFFDPKTSFKAVIVEREDEVVISFGALGSSQSELDSKKVKSLTNKQYALLGAQFSGAVPKMYDQADALVKKLVNHPKFQGKKIKLAGQCLGGSLAQYAGLTHRLETICFNCFPLGAGLQFRLGSSLKKAKEYVTHISCETDFVSNYPGVQYVDSIPAAIGVKTPGNFGKRFSVPTGYPGNRDATHDYIQGSMMKYIGYTTRTCPAELPPEILQM